ncbi:Regulator of microtubule dynamics protein 1 [Pseudolycoriella hygida]|uniref:Regulator of microtubule dynamics protein 1 n=1 Tax=Pseudolycoriella hygida TaxID=35572 RepID=A0A9Q0N6B5_9DIPT|nr:Regulator of microtubule dynamics protein 1 [Pseudolycoriella hygida]
MDQSSIELLKKADQLFEKDRFEDSLVVLKSFHDQSKADVKWRQGRALYKICEKDKNRRQELIPQAFQLVTESLKLNGNDVEAHLWMQVFSFKKPYPRSMNPICTNRAALVDAKSQIDGLYARLKSLPEVKKYMLNAVEINPNYAHAWFALGSYAYGIASATWYEQKVIRLVCPDVSETYEEALEHFLRAEQANPNFCSLIILYIGRCYDALGDHDKAKYYFTKASNVNVLNNDDKMCRETATVWLDKYSKKALRINDQSEYA